MKLCPECGELASFNSHFGAYMCSKCSWRDNSYDRMRVSKNCSKPENKDTSSNSSANKINFK